MKVDNQRLRKPYQQGDLDALCGVYSVVNIVHYMTRLNKTQANALFIDILKVLEKKKRLSYIMSNGLRFRDIKSMLHHFLPQYEIGWYMPFNKKAKLSVDEYWHAMQRFLDENERGCILLRVTGSMDHWTIVYLATEKVMYFRDSNHLHHMLRKNCMIGQFNSSKPYELYPAQTIFVQRVES
ncbi:MAG: hypothetical protein ACXWT7_05500 [Methylophilaceae bacterium]